MIVYACEGILCVSLCVCVCVCVCVRVCVFEREAYRHRDMERNNPSTMPTSHDRQSQTRVFTLPPIVITIKTSGSRGARAAGVPGSHTPQRPLYCRHQPARGLRKRWRPFSISSVRDADRVELPLSSTPALVSAVRGSKLIALHFHDCFQRSVHAVP